MRHRFFRAKLSDFQGLKSRSFARSFGFKFMVQALFILLVLRPMGLQAKNRFRHFRV